MMCYAAVARNKDFILEKFKDAVKLLENSMGNMQILEIASGSGEHIVHLAQFFPQFRFQPTDIDSRCLKSIGAHIADRQLANVARPIYLDISQPFDQFSASLSDGEASVLFDIVININMIHISSTKAVEGLFSGAGQLLRPKAGILFLYGPFAVNGSISPESNVRFNESLRQQNADWGLRDVRYLKELAEGQGMDFLVMHDMPANNKILIFRKV